jgi:hypothetical protein
MYGKAEWAGSKAVVADAPVVASKTAAIASFMAVPLHIRLSPRRESTMTATILFAHKGAPTN